MGHTILDYSEQTWKFPKKTLFKVKLIYSSNAVQIPTRIPEKIVVSLFSGILVNSAILVDYTEVKVGTFSC